MSARDDLRTWITARATDSDDAAAASKMIAAYVAESVREDRKKREAVHSQRREAERKLRETMDKFRDLATRSPI